MTRDLRKVPSQPEQVRLRTGDRIRVEASIGQPAFTTVFNVGPTGNLNLLWPEATSSGWMHFREPGSFHVLDAELTPPQGTERLGLHWSETQLPLNADDLMSLTDPGRDASMDSGSYRATRDLARIKNVLVAQDGGRWESVIVQLDHT